MKKITLLLGAGIGFVAGSKAGPGPYQQLEAKVRELMRRPSGTEAGSDRTTVPPSYTPAPVPPLTGNGTADTVTDGGVVLPMGAEL
jgi:hypothetical protein